eukprot:TRINITY_DN17891_c0_g1_i1.p2 TRINITY_DN17891_c0_g1~~TRINITY_DN17891_c0_g1_i1.p2  ORF type:complete len:405 (+),score=118.12 TRINITY_DN17891_c0_g1_i1:72-1217(+)
MRRAAQAGRRRRWLGRRRGSSLQYLDGRAPLAVLIDGDNISPSTMQHVLSRTAHIGSPVVRRVYGAFHVPTSHGAKRNWGPAAQRFGLEQICVPDCAESTDVALCADAVTLAANGRIAAVALVSADTDFSVVAWRLRELGVACYGFGAWDQTNASFKASVDRFFDLPGQGDWSPWRPALPDATAVRPQRPAQSVPVAQRSPLQQYSGSGLPLGPSADTRHFLLRHVAEEDAAMRSAGEPLPPQTHPRRQPSSAPPRGALPPPVQAGFISAASGAPLLHPAAEGAAARTKFLADTFAGLSEPAQDHLGPRVPAAEAPAEPAAAPTPPPEAPKAAAPGDGEGEEPQSAPDPPEAARRPRPKPPAAKKHAADRLADMSPLAPFG